MRELLATDPTRKIILLERNYVTAAGKKGAMLPNLYSSFSIQNSLFSSRAPGGSPVRLKAVWVRVHYELYDGAPLLAKWVEVGTDSKRKEALEVEAGVEAVEVKKRISFHL